MGPRALALFHVQGLPNGKNKAQAINSYALPVIRYPAGITHWPKEIQKLLTIHGGFTLLDTLRSSLSQNTQDEINKNIFLFLQAGPRPIRCYEGGSFYSFLKNTFLNFGFPNLSMFLSLLPKEHEAELLNTITPSELSQFLSQPNVIGDAEICEIYSNYKKTSEFLENQDVPDDVKLKTLPCIWPLALSSKSRSDARLWFDLRLKNYLPFLKKNLISSTQLKNASCFGFQKFISVMGNNFTYNSTEFVKEDVYNSMRIYLIPGLLKEFCSGAVDPEVNAALVSNFKSFTVKIFTTLGQASGGLSPTQIFSVPAAVLVASLNTLGSVNTWNQEQAMTIIRTMSASGYKINTGSSLSSLGTLVLGVSSETIINIPSSELLSISRDATFVSNMLRAPPVVQGAFVQKIITVDQTPAVVVQNVPDELATQIPMTTLLLTSETLDVNLVNNKTWTQEQAAMFFEQVSTSDFDTEKLSPSVLRGFTCTTVRKATETKIKKLVRACRRRNGRSKVVLTEPQLTCMYNHLKGNLTQDFTEYPSDLLLYFNADDVERTNCRSYFSAIGEADFSVPSSILNKPQQIFSDARKCLGIRGTSLSKDNVMVLGNLTCMLDSSYIQNSDPYILETLKSCKDFSESQVAAIETLLLSGKTPYGIVTTWDEETLQNLAPLPLYFTRNIWGNFKPKTKKRFLKSFMPRLRKSKTEKKKLKALFKEVSAHRVTRGAGCTVGNITAVTVQDPAFPFDYDLTQFDLCLDIPVLKDNLNSICEKVDDDGFQKIILRKLNEAYPAGVSDENVQLLGSVSRTATLDDISKWNITTIDTLSSLMRTEDGPWEAAKSRAVITKYLNTSGNTLGPSELNAIDSNLCALDTTTLKTITPENLGKAKSLNVTSCSPEQKKVLYEISNISFSSYRDNSTSYFNLIKNYLGGAPLADIQALSTQNINMDISTFQSLDPNVINKLTVSEVQGLLGSNVADLKTFENAPVIEAWINLQRQADLDTLGLGLTTTRVDPTSPTPVTNSTVTNTSSNTPATNTSSITPAANTSLNTPAANTTSITPATNTSSNTPVPATNTSSNTPVPVPATNTRHRIPCPCHQHVIEYPCPCHQHVIEYSCPCHQHVIEYPCPCHQHVIEYPCPCHQHVIEYPCPCHQHVIEYSCPCHQHVIEYPCPCHQHVIEYSCPCHQHVIEYSCPCHQHVIEYSCHQHVIEYPCPCHQHVIEYSCPCHQHVIEYPCPCHQHVIEYSCPCHQHVIEYSCHQHVIEYSCHQHTPVPATNTSSNTPATNTSSNTPVPATNTSSNTPVPATNTSSNTPATNTSSNTPVPATNTSSNTPVPATNTSSNTPVPATNTSSNTPVPAANTSSITPAANTSSNTPATNSSAASTPAPGSSATSNQATTTTTNPTATVSNQVTTTTTRPTTTAANNTASGGLPSSLFMVVLLISLLQLHIV
ncbi:uncharacterized protein LOC110155377 [Boleophthalmus pectinirostris]|uniref:uncharacterized protein LOC110155377 n=1 Tax=Boleophthalmus pectinirostris TaxID=150288 RepID=UPI002432D9EF|nr:uncharacterized protein LOC110155377 [Boleophthalmus pectinirostris]